MNQFYGIHNSRLEIYLVSIKRNKSKLHYVNIFQILVHKR